MDFRAYLEKLRGLSDNQKKTVLWTTVAILAIIMGVFWFRATINRFSNFDGKLLNIQFPEIEIPEMQISGNETADWQSYINEEYGFEIKYPKEWEVKKSSQGTEIFISFIENEKDRMTYPQLIIRILNKTYQEAVDEQIFADNQNDIIFDGIPAKEILFNNPIGAVEQLIIVSKNNQTIRIDSFKNSILDPILSTFKFIE